MFAFAAPWALLGLLAAGVPLLLHLVQRHEAPEVFFPAVRYLEDATRDERKRLKFQHWLLLLLRTVLIIAVVLAAAGMSARRSPVGPHAASALVIIVDNSASSGQVADGEPLLASLLRAANGVLDRATLADRVWLIAADGIARAGSAAELRQHLAQLRRDDTRLDLGAAISSARALIRSSGRAGGVVLIGAMQRSALAAGSGAGDLLVLRPTTPVASNRAVIALSAGLQPWQSTGGHINVGVASSDTAPVPVTLSINGRPVRDILVAPGVTTAERIGAQAPGWITIAAGLPPDEFRVDDDRRVSVRIAPPPAVSWDASDRFVAAAAQVLAGDGRIRAGAALRLGSLAAGASVVLPPEDNAQVGALNRALAARGVTWRFGALIDAPATFDSGVYVASREAVARRYQLQSTGSGGDVLATVAGTPWLVRSGNVILVGSRLDPAWTALPLSAAFVPFLDALLTTAARGELMQADLVAGQSMSLPDGVTAIVHDNNLDHVAAAARWVPRQVGIYYLLARNDTVGSISVHADPRVSALQRATDAEITALYPSAEVADLKRGAALAFAFGGRHDLRGVLLLLAVGCALLEALLAGRHRRES